MQCKVGTPGLNARIEQESKGMSMEVKGAEIATFMTIASPTGECQILCRCYATVFLRDDVVNFMREESHTDWKQALLAVLSSPLYYKPAEFYGNIAQAHWAPVREGSGLLATFRKWGNVSRSDPEVRVVHPELLWVFRRIFTTTSIFVVDKTMTQLCAASLSDNERYVPRMLRRRGGHAVGGGPTWLVHTSGV